MKTADEFCSFFQNDLKFKLESLEEQRQKTRKSSGPRFAMLLLAVFGFLYLIFFQYSMIILIASVILVIGAIYLTYRNWIVNDDFKVRYKKEVVERMIHKIDPKLNYLPFKSIGKDVINKSQLFTEKPSRYRGEDLIQGKHNETDFQFSYHKITKTRHNGSGGGNQQTIFKGFLYEADYNAANDFVLIVEIIPMGDFMGKLGKVIQIFNKRPNRVEIDDPTFEKVFAIYSNNESEALDILNTEMRKKLINLYEQTGKGLKISVSNSKIYFAISNDKSYLEPLYSKSVIDLDHLQEDFSMLKLYLHLADEFNL